MGGNRAQIREDFVPVAGFATYVVAFVREVLGCESMPADEVIPYLYEIGVLVDHTKYCGHRRCDGTTR